MFQIVDGRRGGGGDLADKWRRLTAALPAAATPMGTPGADGPAKAGKAGNGGKADGDAKPETSRRKGRCRSAMGVTRLFERRYLTSTCCHIGLP